MPRRDDSILLSGQWECRAGRDAGPRTVRLPGSLDEMGIGDPPESPCLDRLSRLRVFEGPAEFRRELILPPEWAGRRLSLSLERSRSTEVRWDGATVGTSSCLSAAQIFDLGPATLGLHELRILSDNASGVMAWPSVRNSHAASEAVQTNWNGVLGRIELRALPPVGIEGLELDLGSVGPPRSIARLRLGLRLPRDDGAFVGKAPSLELEARVSSREGAVASFRLGPEAFEPGDRGPRGARATLDLPLGPEFPLWDDLHPELVDLELSLRRADSGEVLDSAAIRFGLRRFEVAGTRFQVNGRPVFLRGKHEAGVFPRTGYPPMDIDSWRRVFSIAREWGINHYRFHSWCPPEAAFAAADEIGMYLQPELPFWNPSDALVSDEEFTYYLEEALRVVDAYRNHPSFVMLALGNELVGSRDRMDQIVDRCRERAPGLLCAIGSNNFLAAPEPPRGSDYWTTFWTDGRWNFRRPGYGGRHVRGSSPHSTRGHVNNEPPSTDFDYARAVEGVDMPVIAHEIGQYQVFPDFAEIGKYDGLLRAENLEAFAAAHEERGMEGRSRAFQLATGRLAALCYREEVEAALRTPGLAGFQLLDLQDFPGQGTALVGLLDAFMDTKGLVDPEEWRTVCADTVPLLRARKRVWETGERFSARVELAHHGAEEGLRAVTRWSLAVLPPTGGAAGAGSPAGRAAGRVLAEGDLGPLLPVRGGITAFGELSADLDLGPEPRILRARLELDWVDKAPSRPPSAVQRGPSWDFWVFPPARPVAIPDDVLVVRDWDEEASRFLDEGGKVLLLLGRDGRMASVPGAFIPDFWCYPMFGKYDPPGTLGILCDTGHPALAGFPTEAHADWQWWHLLKSSRPLVLPPSLRGLEPIVRVVDNVHRGLPLGLVFELASGRGRLLACGIDLIGRADRPEFSFLCARLLAYMESPDFSPPFRIGRDELRGFLEPEAAEGPPRAVGSDFFG